jgi:hypothetical protein
MSDHRVELDRQGALETVNGHRQAVADHSSPLGKNYQPGRLSINAI